MCQGLGQSSLLSPAQWQEAGVKVEQPVLGPAPTWDASAVGGGLIYYATALAPGPVSLPEGWSPGN